MANIQGISGVERQQFQFQTLSAEQLQRRISLFTGDRMEAERKIEVQKGEVIALPAFDPVRHQQVVSIFQNARCGLLRCLARFCAVIRNG